MPGWGGHASASRRWHGDVEQDPTDQKVANSGRTNAVWLIHRLSGGPVRLALARWGVRARLRSAPGVGAQHGCNECDDRPARVGRDPTGLVRELGCHFGGGDGQADQQLPPGQEGRRSASRMALMAAKAQELGRVSVVAIDGDDQQHQPDGQRPARQCSEPPLGQP